MLYDKITLALRQTMLLCQCSSLGSVAEWQTQRTQNPSVNSRVGSTIATSVICSQDVHYLGAFFR